jgi:PPM family protein phosphatase
MSDASPQRAAAEPEVFGAAIQGRRSEQQDSFRSVWLAARQAWLLVVADGMGGHAAGAVASRVAADAFVSTFATRRSEGVSLDEAMRGALHDANTQIAKSQEDAPETTGMGTTLVAAHLDADGVAWISVGDSPMWIFRNGAINRINEDHSLRPAVAAGAKAIANMLQSAVNGEPIALVDCRSKPVRLRPGDLVILASDGLLTLSDEEISDTVGNKASAGPEAIVRALLKAVEERGKSNQDNCAVMVAAPHLTKTRTTSAPLPLRWLAAIATVIAIIGVGYFVLS